MAEVVGVIASVITLCQTLDYLRKDTKLVAVLKGAPDEYFHLHNELTAISSHLHRVKDELDNLRTGSASPPASCLDVITQVATDLDDDLKQLKKLASDLEADARGKVDAQGRLDIPKLKWAKRRPAVQRLRERISRKKTDLHHALSVLQINQTTRAASLIIDHVQDSTDNFGNIARSMQTTDTVMGELRSELSNVADAIQASRSTNDTTSGMLLRKTEETNQMVANIEGMVSRINQDPAISSEAISLLRSMQTGIGTVAHGQGDCQNKLDLGMTRLQETLDKLISQISTRGTRSETLENNLERLVRGPDANNHNTHAVDNTLITVHTTLSSGRRCNASCTCQCHKSSTTGTPALLSSLVGKLLLSYNGIPGWRPRACNHPMCQRKSPSQVHLSYLFPRWMLQRGVSFSLSWSSSIAGSSVSLHYAVPRVISDHHPVWFAIETGNKAWLQNKLAAKKVFPTDINETGISLLMYSIGLTSYHCSSLILAEYPIASIAWQDQHGMSFATIVQSSETTHSTIGDLPALCRALDLVEDNLYSTPIVDAVRGINGVSLERALDQNPASINDRDVTGKTALHWAAEKVNIEAVRKLLRYKADVMARDLQGQTPLHSAAVHLKGWMIVQILLEEGSDLNAENVYGRTPLHEAVRWGGRENVLALIEAGAKADTYGNHGRTPFFQAALETGYPATNAEGDVLSIFKALIECGGDVNRRDNGGDTPLTAAINYNNVPVFRALTRLEVELDYQASAGRTVLHVAARRAKSQILRKLIHMDITCVDPDQVDEHGWTATEIFDDRCNTPLDDLEPWQSSPTDEEVKLFERLVKKMRRKFRGIDTIDSEEEDSELEDSEADDSEVDDSEVDDSGDEDWQDAEESLVKQHESKPPA